MADGSRTSSPSAGDDRPNNALLRSLGAADWERLQPYLEDVELKSGEVLYEMDDRMDWVLLPEVGLLSVVTILASGAAIETSIVGREGGVGFVEALGSQRASSRVLVQVPGRAYRLPAGRYCDAFEGSSTMRSAVHRQVELLLAEARQAIACHSLHAVENRFPRWMLECQDLAGGMSVLPLKQEFLAVMLGVQRTTVTQIAKESQKAGLINYSRGRIEIVDRQGLEDAACECRATLQELRRHLEPESVLAS